MTDEMIPVAKNDKFVFNCSPADGCLNECCKNINQFLTPYDIIRLKARLGIASAEFLRTYTSLIFGPETGLPMIVFKPDPHSGYSCPFVRESGCSVYEDRPGSCRLYPLARAVSRSRETGRLTEYFALIQEDHCKGWETGETGTVADWIDSQEVRPYNEMNDRMMEVISLKNTTLPGRLDGRQADLFCLALYDMDTFRREVFENSRLAGVNIPENVLSTCRHDDVALLGLGLSWIKYELFGIPMDFIAGSAGTDV